MDHLTNYELKTLRDLWWACAQCVKSAPIAAALATINYEIATAVLKERGAI